VGEVKGDCIDEEAGCRPENHHHNAYTRSKAVAEMLLRDSGLPRLIIRPSIVLSRGLPDAKFARQILWVAPLFKEFDCLPIDPQAKIDVVPVSYVVEGTLRLVAQPERKYDCYHLSAGRDYALPVGKLTEMISRHYGKNPPLRNVREEEWSEELASRFVATPAQRKYFFALRYYLPFLNMDVVFDNQRLKDEADLTELGLTPPTDYLPELLDMVSLESAVEESQNP
jgi:nucleoside-diphosphate-sugar epimerase